MTDDLFDDRSPQQPSLKRMGDGAFLLRGLAERFVIRLRIFVPGSPDSQSPVADRMAHQRLRI